MLLRPYLMLCRGRVIAGAIVAMLTVIVVFAVISNNICGCPPDSNDAPNNLRFLIASSDILCVLLGLMFGFAIAARMPGAPNEARFLLTRPVSRISIIFYPLAISAAAMALLPAVSWLALLGSLYMVHARAITDLVAVAKLVPAVSALGPHPSFLQLISALHVFRRYMAALSVGLTMYGPIAAQRWFLLSRRKAIRILAGFTALMIPLPMALVPLFIGGSSIVSWVLLLPLQNGSLSYLPSNTGIALHVAFAAAWVCGALFVLRELEA